MQRTDQRFLFACAAALLAWPLIWALYQLVGEGVIEQLALAGGANATRIQRLGDDWVRASQAFLLIGFGVAGLLHARRRLAWRALTTGLVFAVSYVGAEHVLARRLEGHLGPRAHPEVAP